MEPGDTETDKVDKMVQAGVLLTHSSVPFTGQLRLGTGAPYPYCCLGLRPGIILLRGLGRQAQCLLGPGSEATVDYAVSSLLPGPPHH